jgi:NAD(P)-dependent dehydrogenase (short-subunit alcohol dehydrogenase family)
VDGSELDSAFDLTGQVALVTGGSSGLGREISLRLAALGASVGVMARTEDQVEETVAEIARAGGRAVPAIADVSDRDAVRTGVEIVERELGPVDLLVNNAGISGPVAPFWEADPDDWWSAVEVNLRGAALCSSAVLSGMVARKSGRIVNMASNAGIYRWPYLSAYAVSKAAMIKLTENLAVETKKHGIKLFAIDPGMIRVGMTRALLEQEIPPDHPAAIIASWFRQEMAAGREVPLARGAELVAFLASGRADALSGCYLTVYDDLEALVEQAPSIRRGELYTLRLREAN